jgi:hypothetical protein
MRYGRERKRRERMKDFFRCSCGTCSELLTLCCLQVEEMRHKIPSTYSSEIKLQQKKNIVKTFNVLSSSSTSNERQKKEEEENAVFVRDAIELRFLLKNLLKYFSRCDTIHWKELFIVVNIHTHEWYFLQ